VCAEDEYVDEDTDCHYRGEREAQTQDAGYEVREAELLLRYIPNRDDVEPQLHEQ
jgi:hypothetical protein